MDIKEKNAEVEHASATLATAPTPSNDVPKTSAKKVGSECTIVRPTPNRGNAVLTYIGPKDDVVILNEKQNGFYKVKIKSISKEGWIHKSQIR